MARWHDLVVIGLGVGGEQVAGRAAEVGMDVLGIEHQLVGGECPYWGCIPSKLMVRATPSRRPGGWAGSLGVGACRRTGRWWPGGSARRPPAGTTRSRCDGSRRKGGVFLCGHARITGPREVEVDGRRVRARRGS
jgi:pyruvate/2-oxoglutarate dehydrogenase complex dihydrolipoamide dehydrogenase (E3) component